MQPRNVRRKAGRGTNLRLALACALLMTAASLLGSAYAGTGLRAQPAPEPDEHQLPPTSVLTVDVSQPIKEVDHAASGSLYGLGDEGWPPDEWIGPIKPKMFTQPPPGATHRPNGEPEPVGDTLWVQPVAARHGAAVTVRLPDIFPTFPYQWQGDDYWYEQVERIVREVRDSGAENIYGYEIWNEPNWTWNDDWGSYLEMWEQTYNLIREIDPDTPIIGPSDVPDMREFLTFTLETNTVPDIISWHELSPGGGTPSFPPAAGQRIEQHVEYYRELERELGIEPRPISINEYGAPRDAGVPGWLTRYIARLERAEVDTADLAFWHKPGRLADLLVPVGGGSGPARDAEPTGNYWLYRWYADMTGNMVQTIPPDMTSVRSIEVGEPTPLPATRTAGQESFGNAIGLNGNHPNQFVELPDGITQDLTDFTVSAWVRPATTDTWARVFDFGSGTQTNMFLTLNAGSGPRFAITTSGGGTEQRISAPAGTQVPTGQWSHVAVTKSGTTGTLWINGEPVATNTNMTTSPGDLGATTQNWLGRSQYPDPLFNGLIDDVQIYDRGLAEAEIQALAQAPATGDLVGNVASYPFDEADGTAVLDASGSGQDAEVVTATSGVERIPVLDGLASADPATETVRVIFGGGRGDTQLRINGLHSLDGFGNRADVQVFTTEWTGTDGVSAGPIALFEGRYPVRDGSISIPVDGLKDTDAYLAVVTPAGKAADLPGPVRRYEAEATPGAEERSTASPLASNNRYVTAGEQRLSFTVNAPVAGAYDLGVRYTNPTESPVSATVEIDNAHGETLDLAPTGSPGPFATHTTQVVLKKGRNRIHLQSDVAGLDHIEVTPFRHRFQAEDGEWTGAALVRQDMSESNFGVSYFSGDAYVRGLSQPESTLRLPVTVPAAGTYQLSIGYSTAGTEAERRAQTPSGQLLRINDGPAQEVTYQPTQFREMIRQTTVTVELPAGTSTLTLTKSDQPGVVDLDYIDVMLQH